MSATRFLRSETFFSLQRLRLRRVDRGLVRAGHDAPAPEEGQQPLHLLRNLQIDPALRHAAARDGAAVLTAVPPRRARWLTRPPPAPVRQQMQRRHRGAPSTNTRCSCRHEQRQQPDPISAQQNHHDRAPLPFYGMRRCAVIDLSLLYHSPPQKKTALFPFPHPRHTLAWAAAAPPDELVRRRNTLCIPKKRRRRHRPAPYPRPPAAATRLAARQLRCDGLSVHRRPARQSPALQ